MPPPGVRRMQTIFNCCHGMQTNAGKWICSTQPSDPNGLVDEEIIGDESPAYKPHLQGGPDDGGGQSKISPGGGGYQRAPPAPIGHGPEDEKESAKVRLQRLIRDFAHDAVGPGLEIQALGETEQDADGNFKMPMQALLRMDRRLSRIELWPPSTSEGTIQGSSATISLPLQQVASIAKGVAPDGAEAVDPDRDAATLTVVQRGGAELRLVFDSAVSRDRAYTCLRIFQMSVDQSSEGQGREAESELTGYDDQGSP